MKSHPYAQLPTRGPSDHPIIARMKLGHGRNGSYTIVAQLRYLLTRRRVDINEAVHVANAEPLRGVCREELPLRPKTGRRDWFSLRDLLGELSGDTWFKSSTNEKGGKLTL